MTQVVQNFDGGGGSNGVAITPGNSGGGGNTAFDAVDVDTNSIQEFTNVQTYGPSPLSLRIGSRAGTSQIVGPRWQAALGSPNDYYVRLFFNITDVPVAQNQIVSVRDTALNYLMRVVYDTDGKVKLMNAAGTIIGSTAAAASTNTWHRLEYFCHGHATTGYGTIRYYNDPTSAVGSFTDEINAGGATTWAMATGITTEYVSFGVTGGGNNWPSATGFIYFAGIIHGAPDWAGPLVAPGPIMGIRSDLNRGFGPF